MMEISYINRYQAEKGGFNYDLHLRNTRLMEEEKKKNGNKSADESLDDATRMRLRKTGTTICGVTTNEGVVLGADTRATEGPIVAMKNCEKLHRLSNNIFIAGAGVSADLHHVSLMMQSKLELLRLSTHREPRVVTAVTMFQQYLFQYQGHITCAIVMGGVDTTGPQLYKIFPHGSCDRLPFGAMGSGSLNALAVLEGGFRDDLTLEEGKDLVGQAILSGVMNDLGSGGNVDLCVLPFSTPMTPSTIIKSQIIRAFIPTSERPYQRKERFPIQPKEFIREKIEEVKQYIVEEESTDVDML